MSYTTNAFRHLVVSNQIPMKDVHALRDKIKKVHDHFNRLNVGSFDERRLIYDLMCELTALGSLDWREQEVSNGKDNTQRIPR